MKVKVKKMARTCEKTIADIIPNAFTGAGIFSAFNNPIWVYDFDAEALDIQFITTYGDRLAAPYLTHFDGEGGISDDDLQAIAAHIYAIHKWQWEHLYKAMVEEYNPLHNVDAHEIETNDSARSSSAINGNTDENDHLHNDATVDSISGAKSTTNMAGGSGDTDSAGNGLSQVDVSAFNSGSMVGDTANGSNTDALTGTASENTSIINEENADAHDIAASDNDLNSITNVHTNINNDEAFNKREVTRFGNIGLTTSAQLISGEISLWKFEYMQRVMTDICDTIALSIY